jgi:large subunit ribosomal protein L10
MPKTKQQKQETVASLSAGLKQSKSVVFANFQGLKVSEAEELRKTCRKEGVNVLAAKKTLLKIACAEVGLTDIDPLIFTGGVASFFGSDEVCPAKVVHNFGIKHEVVGIYGGVLEGKFISTAEVKSLALLPGKTELLGKLVGTLQAPISGFVNVLAGNMRNLVNVLNNIKEAKA